ncbi:MAG TPA: transketolase [Acholeplasmatales bacterium]|nr:transketolase [Acholeplasmatales bacterium]
MNRDRQAIETLRILAVEQIAKAKSGHPGIALGAAPIIHLLYSKIMNISPKHHQWINRDRFVMSAGHGSALLYSVLYLAGYGLGIDDLKEFRQFGSKTPGHPEIHTTPGVDATTGPLGQGIAMAVGMTIAETYLGAKFNRSDLNLFDHRTYVLCGDGDLQEGVAQEAMSLAGHLGLNKLIVLYDSNDIQLDGKVANANSESVSEKLPAMGWNHILVEDGEDLNDLEKAVGQAQLSNKPTIIEVKTIIGRGSSVANTPKAHGSPLPAEEVAKMRAEFGGEPFSVPNEILDFYQESIIEAGETKYESWMKLKEVYAAKYHREAEQLDGMISNDYPVDFMRLLNFEESYSKATRVSGGDILNVLQTVHPGLIGGSADLASSTKVKGIDGDFSKTNRTGRNLNFGVREHSMAAIANGIALHQGLRPFVSGFFVFSDYMKPAIRLSALMDLPVIYVFTHDSIAVGEDGPTHQPVEQLTMLRSIPNMNVIRPADANETLTAWEVALETKTNPVALVLTRQDVPTVTNRKLSAHLKQGAYVLSPERRHLDGIIMASGSEVKLALDAQNRLFEDGIDVRVVSVPSMFLFDRQNEKYRESVLPKQVKARLAIEMSEASHYYKYLGTDGSLMNIKGFGQSSPAGKLIEAMGFYVENVVSVFKEGYKNSQK